MVAPRAQLLGAMSFQAWAWCMFVAANVARGDAPNDRPIIGILTQPLHTEGPRLAEDVARWGITEPEMTTMIAASYVKFVESAGGRVVPLHFDASDAELTSLFDQVNGILFPGGGTGISNHTSNRFRQAGNLLYSLALRANAAGDVFPIHATCQGFEMILAMAALDDKVLCHRCYTTEGAALPLELTAAAGTSRALSGMSPELLEAVQTQNITANSHITGVKPDEFTTRKLLKDWSVLSTNVDPTNMAEFVSTVEHMTYPFTATQWHPEKNTFEWGSIGGSYEAIPHSVMAERLSQHMGNNFVDAARLSSHRFVSRQAEDAALIYNHPPQADPQDYFTQIYSWKRPTTTAALEFAAASRLCCSSEDSWAQVLLACDAHIC